MGDASSGEGGGNRSDDGGGEGDDADSDRDHLADIRDDGGDGGDGDDDGNADAGDEPVVLVVDDEERVVEAYELWLDEGYEVRTATGGEAALERIDESVDVALLDRHMPGLSGDEVLERIRERGLDCRVAMVTGVDPDFDIGAMPFDDYVQKPLTGQTLRDAVERLLRIDGYDRQINELYGVIQKCSTLEFEKSERELEDSEEYARLQRRREELEAELDEAIASMDAEDAWLLLQQEDDEP